MKSYVEQTLAPNEHIKARANFNWTYNFGSWFFFLLGLLPVVAFAVAGLVSRMPFAEYAVGLWISVAGGVLGIILLVSHYIVLWTTEIVVTSFRFVYKTGLVSRKSNEVSLNKIEEISMSQSILGRMFGYGELIIRGTGVGVIELPSLDNPVQLRRDIEEAKANLRQEGRSDFNAEAQQFDPQQGQQMDRQPAPRAMRQPQQRQPQMRQQPQQGQLHGQGQAPRRAQPRRQAVVPTQKRGGLFRGRKK